ncbi:hypothetical protein FB45DRAFT_763491, partial [Roridomyces roridus]
MLTVIFLVAVFGTAATAQQLTIDTPTTPPATECQPLLITFSGGSPPYIITVDQFADQTSQVIAFNDVTGTSTVWESVNAPAGDQLVFNIRDSIGQEDSSAPFTVASGSDTSYLA